MMKKNLFLPLIALATVCLPACGGGDENTGDDTGDGTGTPTVIVISGAEANVCPETAVTLTATGSAAAAFVWQKDGTEIPGETTATLVATATGAYTVAETGGTFSAPKNVTIALCGELPTQASVMGMGTNACPDLTVTLHALDAEGAESYTWQKNGVEIPGETSATLVVTETGTYTAAGVNALGTGAFSEPKPITIRDCTPQFAYGDLLGYYNVTSTPYNYVTDSLTAWEAQIGGGTNSAGERQGWYSFSWTSAHMAAPYYIDVDVAESKIFIGGASGTGNRAWNYMNTGYEILRTAFYLKQNPGVPGAYGIVLINDWELLWNPTARTLDFSGKYTDPDDGQTYDVAVGGLAVVEEKHTEIGNGETQYILGGYGDAYIDMVFTAKPTTAAVHGRPAFAAAPDADGFVPLHITSVRTVEYDPARAIRKQPGTPSNKQ